jgi:hypothetical protein
MGRARCESCKSIDVRRWQRQGLLAPPGKSFTCEWTCNDESSGSISVFVRDGCVTLGYRLDQNGQRIEQPVYFSWTRPKFGGRRPWFLCPRCIRQVALLCLRGERWACRICCDLAYRSELELKGFRGQMRAQNIQARLGGDRLGFESPPARSSADPSSSGPRYHSRGLSRAHDFSGRC